MPNTYRDSVYLMKLSSQACKESGALRISAMMGSARNKELFRDSGLSTPDVERANADDLVIAVRAEQSLADAAVEHVKALLEQAPARPASCGSMASMPHDLAGALELDPRLDLAVISVAGEYARYEAALALASGMDVMLYSDNISLEDELALKTAAARKKLLVMGPDCGTAIIHGVPLAFANRVNRGGIGLIAASGTGLQEVTCLLDRFGAGVSQAYGTGGRDLKDDIGGLTTLAALDRLLEDEDTRFIGILGKPPGARVRVSLAERLRHCGKPAAVHYLGADEYEIEDQAGILHAGNLTDFSLLLARKNGIEARLDSLEPPLPDAAGGRMRGLFSGGTLCQEAAELAAPLLRGERCSNLAIAGFRHAAPGQSGEFGQAGCGHAFWDFGADEFTVGRPHPMMAPELRMEHLVRELRDPGRAVILLDLVIGYGAAAGQAELVVAALEEAACLSPESSREKIVVASVCGTEKDTPPRSASVAVLRAGGVLVLESNARAAVWAARAVAETTARAVGRAS